MPPAKKVETVDTEGEQVVEATQVTAKAATPDGDAVALTEAFAGFTVALEEQNRILRAWFQAAHPRAAL